MGERNRHYSVFTGRTNPIRGGQTSTTRARGARAARQLIRAFGFKRKTSEDWGGYLRG